MTNKQLRELANKLEADTGYRPDYICPNCGEPEMDGIEVYNLDETGQELGICSTCDFAGVWPIAFQEHENVEVGQKALF